MLQFLQGWLWAFAAVAALPIVLHLLSRQRLRKIPFSSIMLLSRLEKSQMRRLRLRQLLLLILRTLAVLALVFAFTRPLVRGSRAGAIGGEETAAVIVVDGSASMSLLGREGRRMDRARSLASRIIETFGPGDRVAFVGDTGDVSGARFLYSSEEWAGVVDALAPGDGRANLGRAAMRSMKLLDTTASGSNELYVITDGQQSSWQEFPDSVPPDVRVYVADVADAPQPNRTVASIDFGPSLWVAHAPLEVTVTIANSGSDIRDLPVSLFLDGQRVAQQAATVQSGDSAKVLLSVADLSAGQHHGKVEISADAWPNDNQLYFAVEAARGLPVLVVGPRGELLSALSAALRPKPETRTPFLPEVVDAGALATEVDPRFGLVVLAGVPSLPESGWQRLMRFVQKGGGLWVLLDPSCDITNYNEYLFGPLWSGRLKAHSPARLDGSFITLAPPAEHPLFSYLENTPRYPEIRFGGSARLEGVRREAVRQSFSDGGAAVIEAVSGQGRVVLLAGYADPGQSDLIYHPLFVPEVQSTATYVARRGALGARPFYIVGEQPTGVPQSEGSWKWATPLGDTSVLPGGPMTLPKMASAGAYTLLQDGEVRAYFAANIAPAELQLAAVQDWGDIWGDNTYTLLSVDSPVAEQITEGRVGTDLWYPALVLVLGLLIAEMLAAWPRASERT
jgi:hypothetical protein